MEIVWINEKIAKPEIEAIATEMLDKIKSPEYQMNVVNGLPDDENAKYVSGWEIGGEYCSIECSFSPQQMKSGILDEENGTVYDFDEGQLPWDEVTYTIKREGEELCQAKY